jgi:cardiolipin synthase
MVRLLILIVSLSSTPTFAMGKKAQPAPAAPAPASRSDGGYLINADWDRWLSGMAQSPVTFGNDVELLVHGPEYYPVRLEAIRSATRTIDLQTFLWCDDSVGLEIARELAAASRRGVRVRVIIDFFNTYTHDQVYKTIRDAGGELIIYNPPTWGIYDIQRRIHEKMALFDGAEVLIGGVNHCSEYLKETPEKKMWHDIEFRIQGPVVTEMQRGFDDMWNWMARQDRNVGGNSGSEFNGFRALPRGGLAKIYSTPTPTSNWREGKHHALLQHQRPYRYDGEGERFVTMFSELAKSARRKVVVYAPYFIPNGTFELAMLETAKRGVEVTVFTNSKETNDMAFIPANAALVRFPRLIANGLKVYEITQTTLHSKAVMVDDAWLSVGSHNLTVRSFGTNGEANVMTDSPEAIAKFNAMVEFDKTHYRLVTPEMMLERSDETKEGVMLFIGRWFGGLF